MQVLIIGYGSIGKRHAAILKEQPDVGEVQLVTRQPAEGFRHYPSLQDVPYLNRYGYFVIASDTHLHYEQLAYLDNSVKGKIICCEKPLFDTYRDYRPQNNAVYVGYCLRFHPLVQRLKTLLAGATPIYLQAICGSYLPSWRPGSDYRRCYSAKKAAGGGVLLDLSHEIDYTQWLAGNIDSVLGYQTKASDLEIDSDDLATFVGKTERGTVINLSLDYFRKCPMRQIHVHTDRQSIYADLIDNRLTVCETGKAAEALPVEPYVPNAMYARMHAAMIHADADACSYWEGLQVMKTIEKITG